jgi:hypothetical protein
VSGFNQFFFGQQGDEATRAGFAVDHQTSGNLYFGAEVADRSVDRSIIVADPSGGLLLRDIDIDEWLTRAYAYSTYGESLAVRAELQHEVVDNHGDVLAEGFAKLRSTRLKAGFRYFRPGGFRAGFEMMIADQAGDFGTEIGGGGGLEEATAADSERFWVANAFVGYKLPGRRGDLALSVQNLFDESFRFQDTDPEIPTVMPERMVSLRFTLAY